MAAEDPNPDLFKGKLLEFRIKRPDPDDPVKMVELVLYCPDPLWADIEAFATEQGKTIKELLRWCFGMAKAVWDEVQDGGEIVVYLPDGKPFATFCIEESDQPQDSG
jgi:hypothetical protein